MRNSVNGLKRIGLLVALTLAAVLMAHAQAAPAQGAPPTLEGKTAEQVYKNIKVLNGTPADQVIESMHLIRGALGVSCEFCHEDPDRAADTKEPKETARMMMRMVMDLNKNNFKGQQEVTCYTCHRGQSIPATTFTFPVVENGEEVEAKGLPSVDQIVAKYVAALGGEHHTLPRQFEALPAADIPAGHHFVDAHHVGPRILESFAVFRTGAARQLFFLAANFPAHGEFKILVAARTNEHGFPDFFFLGVKGALVHDRLPALLSGGRNQLTASSIVTNWRPRSRQRGSQCSRAASVRVRS